MGLGDVLGLQPHAYHQYKHYLATKDLQMLSEEVRQGNCLSGGSPFPAPSFFLVFWAGDTHLEVHLDNI